MAGARRDPGTGSIRYIPDRDRWQASLLVPDENGKPHRRSRFLLTRKDALAALAQMIRDAERGVTDRRTLPTLADHLERWLRDVVTPAVRPNTLRIYRYHVKNVSAEIGTLRIDKVTPHTIQKMHAGALVNFSPKTINSEGKVLRRAFVFVTRWYGVPSPFADGAVEAPKVSRTQGRTLSGPEGVRLVQIALESGDRLAPLWDVFLSSGLRMTEALGLCWGDVDLDTGLITLAGRLARENHGWEIAPTKTEHDRPIVLLEETCALLRGVRVRQAEERLKAGRTWKQPIPGLIFTRPDGQPLYDGTVRQAFQRALKQAFPANTPKLTPHGLRHSVATQAGRNGAPIKAVSTVLGHADISTTGNLYQHAGIEDALAFREALRRARAGTG